MTEEQGYAILQQIAIDIKGLTVAIQGNGTKGLSERVNDLEKVNKAKPMMILKKRAVDAAVLGVIFVGVQMIGRWQGWW